MMVFITILIDAFLFGLMAGTILCVIGIGIILPGYSIWKLLEILDPSKKKDQVR